MSLLLRARGRVAALAATALVLGGVVAASPATAVVAPLDVARGSLAWGFKSSFRSYVGGSWNSEPAGERIKVLSPAQFDLDSTPALPSSTATPNETLPYLFPVDAGTVGGAGDLSVQTEGGVHFRNPGHGFEVKISDVRVVVEDGDAFLEGDALMIVHAAFEDYEVGEYSGDDLRLAEVESVDVQLDDGEVVVVGTGVSVALEAAPFLPQAPGDALDDFVLSASTWQPQISVSKVEGINPDGSEVITVTGSGFDPEANIASRPPVGSGNPAGIYVVFGKFSSSWRPSEGAASTARHVIDQRWPLPDPAFSNLVGTTPQYALLDEDGSFSVTLKAQRDETVEGTYGVFTYAAGGSPANAAQELFVPVSFAKARASVSLAVSGSKVVGGSATAAVEVHGIADYPAPTGTVAVKVAGRVVGSARLAGGKATVVLPAWVKAGSAAVVAEYSGDSAFAAGASGTLAIAVAKATPSVKISARSKVYFASRPKATVTVTAPAGVVANGKVTVKAGSTVVGTGTVRAGKATVTLGSKLVPGSKKLVAEFAGNADLARAKSSSVKVSVAKAKAKVSAKLKKSKVTRNQRAVLRVSVKATGTKPAGTVKVLVTEGSKTVKTLKLKVKSGKTFSVKLPKLKKGKYAVKATFQGSKTVAKKSAKKVTLRVS